MTRISLTAPLAAETEIDPEWQGVLDEVADWVEHMVHGHDVDPAQLVEMVASYVKKVIEPDLALLEHATAPTSWAIH
jgi:hypothetical protein